MNKTWQYIAVTFIILLCSGSFRVALPSMGISPNQNELGIAKNWFDNHFSQAEQLPISFIYDGVALESFCSDWTFHKTKTTKSENNEQWVITLTDPKTKLVVRCIATLFSDYPAVEWVVEFENKGKADTPILKDIQACHVELFPEGNDFILHHALGSNHGIDDFAPLKTVIKPQSGFTMAPDGGRSSDKLAFPFFNIQAGDEGAMVGIGWTGQWQSQLQREKKSGIVLRAGMELTHLKLFPGEKIRTPRIVLLFWKDQDRLRGHNLFRQFILKHHTPQQNGLPLQGPLCCNGGSTMFNEFTLATEHNMIGLAERFLQFGLHAEYWWIDAGWYGSMDWHEGAWSPNVGNWYIRKEHFPNGLRPVSDAMKKMGMKFLLWFEVERVWQGTKLSVEHPDWVLLQRPDEKYGILDLGNPQARQWAIDYVSNMITEQDISIYRQDFNTHPLNRWRVNDEPDRKGITEIRYIEGLYTFWDELLQQHPGLIIDNCASGGRRLDLETISRSIALWRTDYNYTESNGRQNHNYALHFYLPCHGTGNMSYAPSPYTCRSSYASSLLCGWNLYKDNFPKDVARYLLSEYKKVRPYFFGDYYPLTEYSTSFKEWLGYQFYRQDLKQGMVLLFRRPQCKEFSKTIQLHGLDDNAHYELTFEDCGGIVIKSGKELKQGLNVIILDCPGSLLITFEQK